MERRELLRGFGLTAAAALTTSGQAATATVTATATTAVRGAATSGGSSATGSASATLDVSAETLRTYRRILAAGPGEDVCCWYLGTLFMRPAGMPDIPVNQAETIMVYRARESGSDELTIAWTEIGFFRDPIHGGPSTEWLNPLTGALVPLPHTFRDGPGEYRIRVRDRRLEVTLEQSGAVIEGVEAALTEEGARLRLEQVERKVRGVKPGASAPELAALPKSITTLTLWADAAEARDPGRPIVHASGAYSFETGVLPAYAGVPGLSGSTIVRGAMRKADTREIVNPGAWRVVKAAFPDFFEGERVAPKW